MISGIKISACGASVGADGFSAIEIKNGRAFLDVVVGRSDSLGTSAEWAPVSTNMVEVPAPGEQGFFIVVPSLPSNWIAPVPMPPIPVR